MLKGDLSLVSLASIVQLCCQEKKTGCLSIYIETIKVGDIFLKNGEVVAARTSDLKGEIAFYKLFGIKKGQFIFKNTRVPKLREISSPCEHLLLEAVRYQDERKKHLQNLINRIKKINKVEDVILIENMTYDKNIYLFFSQICRLLETGKMEYFWYQQGNQIFLILNIYEEILKIILPYETVPEEIFLQVKNAVYHEKQLI